MVHIKRPLISLHNTSLAINQETWLKIKLIDYLYAKEVSDFRVKQTLISVLGDMKTKFHAGR